jgi:hypothetical protein
LTAASSVGNDSAVFSSTTIEGRRDGGRSNGTLREWAAAKHGGKGRRGWRKLHLGVDGSGVIVAQVLTEGNTNDAVTVPDLLGQFEGELSGFVADAAYDSRPVYDAATQRGAIVVVPPTRNATVGGRNVTQCSARNRTVARIREVGRRQWKKESGYHGQGTVENAFFRYKSIIGDRGPAPLAKRLRLRRRGFGLGTRGHRKPRR